MIGGFLDADGKPTARYYAYLDLSRSEVVLAGAIREAFSDLFAINKDAHKLTTEQVKNKLRTLYAGGKKDSVIGYIAATFTALAKAADFESAVPDVKESSAAEDTVAGKVTLPAEAASKPALATGAGPPLGSLQYHINIVLPESRDQAVYDAIFKALKDHLV